MLYEHFTSIEINYVILYIRKLLRTRKLWYHVHVSGEEKRIQSLTHALIAPEFWGDSILQ